MWDACCTDSPQHSPTPLPRTPIHSALQSKGLSAACLMEEYLDGPEVDVDLVFSQVGAQ